MSFSATTQAIHEALQAIAEQLPGFKAHRWTGQEAFTPPACWIAGATLSDRENRDQCSKLHHWTFELRFLLDPAATANRELTTLEQVVDVASLELETRSARPSPFAGRQASITSARLTNPLEEGVTAFVVQLRVAIRVQHEIPTP